MEIKLIYNDDYKVVNDAGTWLYAGSYNECVKFINIFKPLPTKEGLIGKIIDSCFCGEVSRDEAIELIIKLLT